MRTDDATISRQRISRLKIPSRARISFLPLVVNTTRSFSFELLLDALAVARLLDRAQTRTCATNDDAGRLTESGGSARQPPAGTPRTFGGSDLQLADLQSGVHARAHWGTLVPHPVPLEWSVPSLGGCTFKEMSA